jgi:hypothetical protein
MSCGCDGEKNSVTNAVPIGSTPPMPMPAGSKNDPKPGKNGAQRTPPVSTSRLPIFSLLFLLEKSSKSLIPLGDCPFVLNRLPVFLENLPVSGKKQGPWGACLGRQGEAGTAIG